MLFSFFFFTFLLSGHSLSAFALESSPSFSLWLLAEKKRKEKENNHIKTVHNQERVKMALEYPSPLVISHAIFPKTFLLHAKAYHNSQPKAKKPVKGSNQCISFPEQNNIFKANWVVKSCATGPMVLSSTQELIQYKNTCCYVMWPGRDYRFLFLELPWHLCWSSTKRLITCKYRIRYT